MESVCMTVGDYRPHGVHGRSAEQHGPGQARVPVPMQFVRQEEIGGKQRPLRDTRKSAAMRNEGTSQRIVLDEIVAPCITHGEKHICGLCRSIGCNEHPVFACPIAWLGRRRILDESNRPRISRERSGRKQREHQQEEELLHGFSPEHARKAIKGSRPEPRSFPRSRTSIDGEESVDQDKRG